MIYAPTKGHLGIKQIIDNRQIHMTDVNLTSCKLSTTFSLFTLILNTETQIITLHAIAFRG